jgi:Xaa-Pro aminopeptidase
VLSELLKNTDKIYFRIGENHEFDSTVETAIETARKSRGRSGLGMPALVDLKQIIGEMRLYKSADEIALLRKACEISAEGHLRAMRVCKPGMYEYQIEAEIMHEFRMRGSERLGYGSIVGRGANATVLHYVSNNDKLMSDDLILIDAGAEYGYFTGDITRTFPVNGKFSPPQKKLYEAVLKVQKSCIAFAKPGVKLADIHQHAIAGLVDEMLELKLLSGSKNSLIENKDFFKYYPHGTGHWLGMDVHDAGLYTKNGEGRKLEPGMCFTIEPGLYVPVDDKNAPAEYRGLGIRIEDDILITPQGCEVLTSLAPKDVEAIEAIIGTESGPKSYRV